MRESVEKHLVCPVTAERLSLQVRHKDANHVIEGELVSSLVSTQKFPIRDGVPRFVEIDELDVEQKQNVDTFSFKWSRIPNYAHEEVTKRNRERWYFERFGFKNGDADLATFLKSARFVLEAGTGTGADTDLLARNFDGIVFGIDISRAIDIAFERFRHHPRIVLLQADIGRLPFRKGFFDLISCDQVLHHTPDPRGNFTRLVELLRPGGRIILYVYKVKGALREFADDYLRGIHTRSCLEECLSFSERITELGRSLSSIGAKVQIDADIPELSIRRGTYDLQRFIYDHILKCFWNDDYNFETNVMINFDWYRPVHAFRFREEDIRGWCAEEGLKLEHIDVSPSGISTIMQKPG